MTRKATYYQLGKAIYRLYRSLEKNGTKLTINTIKDGKISTPEGLLDTLSRMADTRIMHPGEIARFVTPPDEYKHDD